MANMKTFVTYHAATGAIRNVYRAPADDNPAVPADHDILKLNPNDAMPTPRTHRVDLGPPKKIVARTAGDQQGEKDARRKRVIERLLADLDNRKAALNLRGFAAAEAEVDAQISDLEAEYATLP